MLCNRETSDNKRVLGVAKPGSIRGHAEWTPYVKMPPQNTFLTKMPLFFIFCLEACSAREAYNCHSGVRSVHKRSASAPPPRSKTNSWIRLCNRSSVMPDFFVKSLGLLVDSCVRRLQVVELFSSLLALRDRPLHVAQHVRLCKHRAASPQVAVLAL